jgi:hypothetical protein
MGDGTVIDRLTGLQWEQKTDDMTPHDKDNLYSWSTTGDGDTADADGTAFTSFLLALNAAGFAGHYDWRLPTIAELQTILLEPYPCTTSPCIDPVFGPTIAGGGWSATTNADSPSDACYVAFNSGYVGDGGFKGYAFYVRAVRAGL